LLDPQDAAHHPVIAFWIIGDLAEAAIRADRVERARARSQPVTPAPSWVATSVAWGGAKRPLSVG
jgi:hypothetical protein